MASSLLQDVVDATLDFTGEGSLSGDAREKVLGIYLAQFRALPPPGNFIVFPPRLRF